MGCLSNTLRRSSVLAGLLVLTACGPAATHTHDDTGTQSTGTPQQTITDDSSAGPGTSETGPTSQPSTTGTATSSDTDPGLTTTGSCGTVDCEPCDALDKDQCSCCGGSDTDTGGCMQQRGDRLNREQACLDVNEFAECVPAGGCLGWIVAFVDPDGSCWLISEDCGTEGPDSDGWTLDDTFTVCPELADWETDPLPPC